MLQSSLAKVMLQRFLEHINVNRMEGERLSYACNELWAENGDQLSKIYAGTGALKSSVTRSGKQTVFGMIDDAAKSVSRFYVNNFQDKGRQEAIDLLLGNTLSRGLKNNIQTLHRKANKLLEAFTEEIRVLVTTWNVNGKLPYGEPLEKWLVELHGERNPHVIIVGIQELIELKADQYVTADTESLKDVWEKHMLQCLNAASEYQYCKLRSLNLVALGIFAFAREDCLGNIRNLETCIVKTGFGGLASNKGGVGVSFRYHETRMAFVTAHFAA
ncbi:inositol polyphosphate 5-phosphatase, partial [Chytridiales sp. JEL 0842]